MCTRMIINNIYSNNKKDIHIINNEKLRFSYIELLNYLYNYRSNIKIEDNIFLSNLKEYLSSLKEKEKNTLKRLKENEIDNNFTYFHHQVNNIKKLSLLPSSILADDMGLGKSQDLEEPILTPNGWKKIKELKLNDEVINANGLPTRVIGIYPKGKRTLYKITCSDKSYTYACEDHLWEVQTTLRKYRKQSPLIKSTKDLLNSNLKDKNGNNKYYLPIVKPIQYSKKELPIHPYVLGVLIGDGCLKYLTSTFCGHYKDEEIAKTIDKLLPMGYKVNTLKTYKNSPNKNTYSIVRVNNQYEGFSKKIERLNLKCGSLNKFIPRIYLESSIEDRKALLAGLLDTDGYGKNSVCEFGTSSKQLNLDFCELVQSLGGTTTVEEKVTASTNLGWKIQVSLPKGENPFWLTRKKLAYTPKTKYEPTRPIISIEKAHEAECACIEIECPRSLYVTRNFILTHNCLTLLSLIEENHKVIFFTNVVGKEIIISEAKRFLPKLKIESPKEFSIPKESNTVYIYTYNSLPPLSKECKDKIPLEEYLKEIDENTFLIADEYHNVKNFKAQRTKRFRALSKHILKKKGKVIGSTGSPILKSPNDLWCLLQNLELTSSTVKSWENYSYLMGGYLDKNYKGKFFINWDHEKIKETEVKNLLEPILIRHSKENILRDLPSKIRTYIYIPIKSKIDIKLLTEYNEQYLDKKEIPKSIKDTIFNLRKTLSKQKTEYTKDFIKELIEENTNEPILVFSAFLDSAKEMAKTFSFDLITGETTAEERKEIQDRFQAGESKGISATIGAGGTALTLTRANKCIFIDRDWSNLNLQAEDRIRRIGQNKVCNYYYILSDHPLERRITEILHRKEETSVRTLKTENTENVLTLITQIEQILDANLTLN